MGGYANRELVRDNVTGIWWKVSALFSVCGFVLAAVDGYSWLVLALGSGFGARGGSPMPVFGSAKTTS